MWALPMHSLELRPPPVEALITPHSSFAGSISGLHGDSTCPHPGFERPRPATSTYHRAYLSCSHEFSSCSHFTFSRIYFPTQISNTNMVRFRAIPSRYHYRVLCIWYCLEQKFNNFFNSTYTYWKFWKSFIKNAVEIWTHNLHITFPQP